MQRSAAKSKINSFFARSPRAFQRPLGHGCKVLSRGYGGQLRRRGHLPVRQQAERRQRRPLDGMLQEFEIAKEKGLALIPVGATGYVAGELWNKVMADLPAYYPNRTADFQPLLASLGNADVEPTLLIDAVIRIIDLSQT